MKLILGTFLFSVGSALIPVLNVEIYLAALRFDDVERIVAKPGETITINLTNSDGFHDWVLDEFNASTNKTIIEVFMPPI